jgi:hypothetical protein
MVSGIDGVIGCWMKDYSAAVAVTFESLTSTVTDSFSLQPSTYISDSFCIFLSFLSELGCSARYTVQESAANKIQARWDEGSDPHLRCNDTW